MKTITSFLICGIVFTLLSCGNSSSSAEADAKKIAEIYCRAQQLAKKAATGDMSAITESTKLSAEVASTYAQMQGKYTTSEDAAKFLQAYNNAILHCN